MDGLHLFAQGPSRCRKFPAMSGWGPPVGWFTLMLLVVMLGPGRYCGDSGVVPQGPFGGGYMLLGGDWIIGYSLCLSWLGAQFAPPFPLSSLRSPGGWSLRFTGSGLQSRSRPRMDPACSLRVPVDAASSQLCQDGGRQWAWPSPGAW
ncbi:hypothetical protein NDU88_005154 [Pleurodeles waltl]|uniref:Uncharacterized protein n=1 Tax=Pleurodeles waltl TaxID=8319 RepID=A0AAV7NLP3_PLEWA|nr:hypothetical protein NDU88_005154 [Pleurodeles waltl]